MWGWYQFSSGIFKKKWDQTVHHKKLIQSVWKLIGYLVNIFKILATFQIIDKDVTWIVLGIVREAQKIYILSLLKCF